MLVEYVRARMSKFSILIPILYPREEKHTAGLGNVSTSLLFLSGEELHQRHLWLPRRGTLHDTLRHPKELPFQSWQHLLLRSRFSRAGRPTLAWSWFRMALLGSLGLSPYAQLYKGAQRLLFKSHWFHMTFPHDESWSCFNHEYFFITNVFVTISCQKY